MDGSSLHAQNSPADVRLSGLLQPIENLAEPEVEILSPLDLDLSFSLERIFDGERLQPVVIVFVEPKFFRRLLSYEALPNLKDSFEPRDIETKTKDYEPRASVALSVVTSQATGRPGFNEPERDSLTMPNAVVIDEPPIEVNRNPIVDELVKPVEFQERTSGTKQGETTDQEKDQEKFDVNQAEKTPERPQENGQAAENSAIETVKKLIEQQKELINSNESIDDVVKAAQLEQLNSASTAIQKAKTSQALIDFRKSEQKNFENAFKSLQSMLNAPFTPDSPADDMTSEELQMRLQEIRQQLQEQKTNLSEIQNLLANRDKRILDIPGLRTAVSDLLNTFKRRFEEFAAQPDDQEKEFSTLALNAQKLAAQKEIEALDIDALYQERFGKLWLLDRDLRTRNLKILEANVSEWESAISRRRESEVAEQQRQASEAREKAIKADPSLKPLALRNQELAQIRSRLTDSIKTASEEVNQAKSTLEEIEAKLKFLKKIGETGQVTTANGMLLVENRRNLTPTSKSQARIQEIKTEVQVIRLANLELNEERENLASPDEIVRELVDEYNSQTRPSKISLPQVKKMALEFEKMALELASTQRTYLKDLEKDYDIYLSALAKIENNLLDLINKIRETREYIDEKALWIRSSNPVSLQRDIGESRYAIASYFAPHSWEELIGYAKNRIVHRPYESAFAVFGIAALFGFSRRLRPSDD